MRKHNEAEGEHERAAREHGGAVREQMNETDLSARAKRRGMSPLDHVLLCVQGNYLNIYTLRDIYLKSHRIIITVKLKT